jgi:hypothetical protein
VKLFFGLKGNETFCSDPMTGWTEEINSCCMKLHELSI